jgi:uncharacterized protein
MRAFGKLLATPLIFVACVVSLAQAEVRDKAGLFSPDAVKKANAELARIERETNLPVTIETLQSLNGQPIKDAIRTNGRSEHIKGLFVLIAVKEHKTQTEASPEYARYFEVHDYDTIAQSFTPGFKKSDFDGGLLTATGQIDSTVNSVKTAHGGTIVASAAKPVGLPGPRTNQATRRNPAPVPQQQRQGGGSGMGSLIGIVLAVLALVVVFKVIGAIFGGGRNNNGGYQGGMRGGPGYGGGGPGYGGPGYGGGGGGGGGFFSNMMGGIGGAFAGNWLYDQFSGRRHHDSGYQQDGNASPADNTGNGGGGDTGGADWKGGGGDDWGGGGGGDTGGGGGGDWGGGGGGSGGGDWGGGGGGGDWGGGGDGGSW